MPVAARGDRNVHYTVTGQGPGMVLVPGLGGGSRQFGTLPRRFQRDGFTCAAVDPVGMPPSGPLPPGGYSFAAAADDVLAVAATLPPPVTLVGTSLGGKVALVAAASANAPIAGLVMLCSAALITPRARLVYRWFELIAELAGPDQLGELIAPFLFGSTFHRERSQVVRDIVRSTDDSPTTRALMRAQATALADFDGSVPARGCRVPTLCLAGAEDTLTPPEEVLASAAVIPGAEAAVLPAAGHSLLLESAAAYERVLAFARARLAST